MAALVSDTILSKYPDQPMKALWEALNDTALVGPEVAIAIVNDPRCGINRQAGRAGEGDMKNTAFNLTLNGGVTPLILATLAGRDDVMEALLSSRTSCWLCCCCCWPVQIVHAKESHFGYTVLHVASLTQNMSAIELLLAKGSDVKAVAQDGDTPLHLAIRYVNSKTIELLLAKGSDVKAVTKVGATPLHYAAYYCKPEVTRLLIGKGSNVNAVTKYGDTPLHLAAKYSEGLQCTENMNNLNLGGKPEEVIKLLIANGGDVSAHDKCGCSPLHYAASFRSITTIELLIANGSDLLVLDVTTYHPECRELLIREGSNYTRGVRAAPQWRRFGRWQQGAVGPHNVWHQC